MYLSTLQDPQEEYLQFLDKSPFLFLIRKIALVEKIWLQFMGSQGHWNKRG